MKIGENLTKSLQLANNTTAVTDSVFKNLLENCFAVLTGSPEPHSKCPLARNPLDRLVSDVNTLYNSKPDLMKELYAALLSTSAEFVRTGQNGEQAAQFLSEQCGYSAAKTALYGGHYERSRAEIEASLVNIGNYLPHVTDVTWKIDYIIKSSFSDSSGGPLFRIGLQTEKYDSESDGKKIEFVTFTCDSQELQDLVYKLKDAVRHCQRIGSEH
jgi:hypothetical protein